MRRWFPLSSLPVAIGALILLVPWFYLTWNTTMGEFAPALRFRTKETLAGVMEDATPDLSWDAIVKGRYQRSISLAVGILSPVFKPAIHWKNQLYYTLLGTAGSPKVIVGRDKQLLEMTYIREYCSRDLSTFRPRAEVWASRIRALQDTVEGRGKAFLYVVTPSKVAQNPSVLPAGYVCPSHAEDRARKLEVYDEILDRNGVHAVDAASIMPAAREKYGIDMFPRGGIHWNALGSAIATQRVIAAINAEHLAPPLTTFDFTWKVSYTPSGSDRDLLDIMNLPYPDTHYPVPELSFQSAPPPGACHHTHITEVGGSFLAQINETLGRQSCPPDITYWFYWDKRRIHYTDQRPHSTEVDAGDRRRSLRDAEVILLEENEAAMPTTDHASALMQQMDKRPAQ